MTGSSSEAAGFSSKSGIILIPDDCQGRKTGRAAGFCEWEPKKFRKNKKGRNSMDQHSGGKLHSVAMKGQSAGSKKSERATLGEIRGERGAISSWV